MNKVEPFRITVDVPGDPVALSPVSKIVSRLTVCALPTNTTRVAVGGPSVRARDGELRGVYLVGGTRGDMRTYDNVDLADMYVDAVTAGEGICGEAIVP